MKQFEVLGPLELGYHKGSAARVLDRETRLEFLEDYEEYSERRGCYVFAIRASRGFTPIYVGKATKTFRQECFTGHKLTHYNRALADYARGTPVLFLVAEPPTRGRSNTRAIGEIESYLIALAERANPNLSNVQGRAKDRWGIKGVVRSGKGKTSKSSKDFRRLLNL